jgi:hypothetical protein
MRCKDLFKNFPVCCFQPKGFKVFTKTFIRFSSNNLKGRRKTYFLLKRKRGKREEISPKRIFVIPSYDRLPLGIQTVLYQLYSLER